MTDASKAFSEAAKEGLLMNGIQAGTPTHDAFVLGMVWANNVFNKQRQEEQQRYRFLLGLLIERGVLTNQRYAEGTWCLRGIYGVDDSGLKGAGRTPEEAVSNAILAQSLDPKTAMKFWSDTHLALSKSSTTEGNQ